jgi:tRNA-specific adenosine deaminase 3
VQEIGDDIAQVPSRAPLIRSQYERCKKLWPINFRENKYLTSCVEGTHFSDEDKTTIKNLITQAMELLSSDKREEAALVASGSKMIAKTISDVHRRPLDHAVKRLVDTLASAQLNSSQPEDDNGGPKYLCTDCDVYLTCEPCIYCAMMLTHSRVKRIFYLEGRNCGEPGISHFEINSLSQLNHRYEAWKISFNQCPTC